MSVSIDEVTPSYGRAADTIVIDGTGFSASPGQNVVTVDGQAATIGAESATQITITVPGSIATDQHVDVSVTNSDDATADTIPWWSQIPAASREAYRVPMKRPGPLENANTESADVCEAKDWERLATKSELVHDLLNTKGDLALVNPSDALRRLAVGTNGHCLAADAVNSPGGAWQAVEDIALTWGRQLEAADTSGSLAACGTDTLSTGTSAGAEHVAPRAGKLVLVSVRVRTVAPDTDRVDRIELQVNGVTQIDSDDLDIADQPGLLEAAEWWTYAIPALSVSAGDRIGLIVHKDGTASVVTVLGLVLLR